MDTLPITMLLAARNRKPNLLQAKGLSRLPELGVQGRRDSDPRGQRCSVPIRPRSSRLHSASPGPSPRGFHKAAAGKQPGAEGHGPPGALFRSGEGGRGEGSLTSPKCCTATCRARLSLPRFWRVAHFIAENWGNRGFEKRPPTWCCCRKRVTTLTPWSTGAKSKQYSRTFYHLEMAKFTWWLHSCRQSALTPSSLLHILQQLVPRTQWFTSSLMCLPWSFLWVQLLGLVC